MRSDQRQPTAGLCCDPICVELELARREGAVVVYASPEGVVCKWLSNGVTGRGRGPTIREAWDRCTEDWNLKKRG
jgi:hypothetical protein